MRRTENYCMTDMQLIAPVREDDVSLGDHSKNGNGRTSVLSKHLKDQFEAMKSLQRTMKRSTRNEEEELKRKERGVALKTAVAIESEITMWQNGIAELEAIIAREDGEEEVEDIEDESHFRPIQVIRFPTLPPVIPAEEEEIGSDGSNNSLAGKAGFDSPSSTGLEDA